jgi:hypothetical protein
VKKRVTSQAEKVGQKRAPLGEITNAIANVFAIDDLLKPFKSPVNKSMGVGHLSGQSSDKSGSPDLNLDSIAVETHHMGVLLDQSCIEAVQPLDEDLAKGNSLLLSPRTPEEKTNDINCIDGSEENDQKSSRSSSKSSTTQENEPSSNADALPSIGSALHYSGECKRCNFFAKGRCQNGKDCSFCHFPHDVRKPTRQEKRDRRDSKLQAQTGKDPQEEEPVSCQQIPSCGLPLLDCFHVDSFQTHPYSYDHDNDANDETYAYSIFPGLPPVRAMKLPAPLALPTMDTLSQTNPPLPPGLVKGPRSNLSASDKTNAAVPSTLLSTTPSSSIPLPAAGPVSSALLSTTPAVMTSSVTEVNTKIVAMVTAGTQTDEYSCPKCETRLTNGCDTFANFAKNGDRAEDTRWTRDELLRLRSACSAAQTSEATLCRMKSVI